METKRFEIYPKVQYIYPESVLFSFFPKIT